MDTLDESTRLILEMNVELQERHNLYQSGIPVLASHVLGIISNFALELEVNIFLGSILEITLNFCRRAWKWDS